MFIIYTEVWGSKLPIFSMLKVMKFNIIYLHNWIINI